MVYIIRPIIAKNENVRDNDVEPTTFKNSTPIIFTNQHRLAFEDLEDKLWQLDDLIDYFGIEEEKNIVTCELALKMCDVQWEEIRQLKPKIHPTQWEDIKEEYQRVWRKYIETVQMLLYHRNNMRLQMEYESSLMWSPADRYHGGISSDNKSSQEDGSEEVCRITQEYEQVPEISRCTREADQSSEEASKITQEDIEVIEEDCMSTETEGQGTEEACLINQEDDHVPEVTCMDTQDNPIPEEKCLNSPEVCDLSQDINYQARDVNEEIRDELQENSSSKQADENSVVEISTDTKEPVADVVNENGWQMDDNSFSIWPPAAPHYGGFSQFNTSSQEVSRCEPITSSEDNQTPPEAEASTCKDVRSNAESVEEECEPFAEDPHYDHGQAPENEAVIAVKGAAVQSESHKTKQQTDVTKKVNCMLLNVMCQQQSGRQRTSAEQPRSWTTTRRATPTRIIIGHGAARAAVKRRRGKICGLSNRPLQHSERAHRRKQQSDVGSVQAGPSSQRRQALGTRQRQQSYVHEAAVQPQHRLAVDAVLDTGQAQGVGYRADRTNGKQLAQIQHLLLF